MSFRGKSPVPVLVATLCALLVAAPGCRGRSDGRHRLRVLVPYLPDEIDPWTDTRLVGRVLAVNVFDPLVRADASGAPVPALASSWSNPEPDVWRLRLRQGARFSDGTPVTAAEVVKSLERARAPGSAVAGSLAAVRRIQVEAPDVLTITATEGSGVLLQTLTSVLIARQVPGGAAAPRFLGSGPYEVTRFVPGVSVEMRASPSRAGPRPLVTEAVWERFGSGAELREKLRTEPFSVVIDPPDDVVAWAKTDRRLAVSSEFSGALAYLAFALAPVPGGGERPFADRRRREAVRLALDVPALLAAIGPAAGFPATQVVPPGVFGFDPAIPLRSRNVDAARRLLAGTGLPGRRVDLDANEANAATARAIAAQLGEAGLAVDVRVRPSRDFRERIEGLSDLFLFSWVVGPEAGEALKNFFHTRDAARRLGLRNRTGYGSPEFDGAIEAALGTAEPAERLPLLQRAVHVLDRDLPWVPLFTFRSVRIHPAGLRLRFRSDGMLLLADVGSVSGRG